ncbi:MAG: hypothetical protein U1D55_13310 [Phycisphaerae bacterium]
MCSALREQLMEADEQMRRRGLVWDTLTRLARALDKLQVRYAVGGGIALQHHGVLRSTQDVDVIVPSVEDLNRIHTVLVGRGFERKSPTSRHLRDDVTRVRVEFLISGEFPGDGKPKPVSFPDPAAESERSDDGFWFITLRGLIELKLASAISAPHRIKDRADVLELLHRHSLPAAYADSLSPYVRDEFRRLAALPPPFEPE